MTAQTTEMWIYDQLKSALSAKKKKKKTYKKKHLKIGFEKMSLWQVKFEKNVILNWI